MTAIDHRYKELYDSMEILIKEWNQLTLEFELTNFITINAAIDLDLRTMLIAFKEKYDSSIYSIYDRCVSCNLDALDLLYGANSETLYDSRLRNIKTYTDNVLDIIKRLPATPRVLNWS